jgi:hypothetical protein
LIWLGDQAHSHATPATPSSASVLLPALRDEHISLKLVIANLGVLAIRRALRAIGVYPLARRYAKTQPPQAKVTQSGADV